MTTARQQGGLDGALETIEQTYGVGTVMRLGDRAEMTVATVSTGCLSLDVALGTGGLPRGRIVEIFGPESSGKTTLTLHALAEAQKAGGTCVFIDAEHALDARYARKLGVNTDELLVSQPDFGEQALEILDVLTRSGGVALIVVDSVAALTPRTELEGTMGDKHVGLQARMMSQALRKITANTSRTGTLVLFINQLRQKIGVTFGNGEVTTGGNALKFYSSVRIDIRRIGAIKKDNAMVGSQTRIKVVKNKMAPPFREALVDIHYGIGISAGADLLDQGLKRGHVTKSGSWFSAGDDRLGQGKEAAWKALLERPELCDTIRSEVLSEAGIAPQPATPAKPPEKTAAASAKKPPRKPSNGGGAPRPTPVSAPGTEARA
jgi:recombination protein RecA